MNRVVTGEGWVLYEGDCREVMRGFPDESFDAIITDPPYGLEFMGKEWDAPWKGDVRQIGDATFQQGESRNGKVRHGMSRSYGGDTKAQMVNFQLWSQAWATEALRVLKPGGHLLAFGGTRTWHRLAVAVEDAGFEIRDSIAWIYGSGFPKSLDVSKAIDKAAGCGRTVIGQRDVGPDIRGGNFENAKGRMVADITAPATPAAQQWQGWGTALKPAFEPIVVARKPLIGTVAENVLAHGTGALNIDGCRIAGDVPSKPHPLFGVAKGVTNCGAGTGRNGEMSQATGRWPANVVLSHTAFCEHVGERDDSVTVNTFDNGAKPFGDAVGEPYTSRTQNFTVPVWDCAEGCPVAELDRQSGPVGSWSGNPARSDGTKASGEIIALGERISTGQTYETRGGGASRFFYIPKAGNNERPRQGDTTHPTVKPLQLMRHLIRLITPPNGKILDPFAGTGTTLEAAIIENFHPTGIEQDPTYIPLIHQRLNKPIQPTLH